jgi:hypothetical protein
MQFDIHTMQNVTRTDINEQGLRTMWATDAYCTEMTSEGGNKKRVSAHDIVISPQDIFATYTELPSGYRITTAKFDSCGQFTEQVDRMLCGKTAHSAYGANRKTWLFGDDQTITSTRQHAKDGTPANDSIVSKYESLKREVDKHMTCDAQMSKCVSARRKRKKSWGGGNLNINRVLESRATGKPMPCFNQSSRRADRPVIRIGMRISMTCGGNAYDFAKVSAMCAVIAERFEMMGYGVEIWGMCVSEYSRTFTRLPNGDKCAKQNGRWACNMWKLKGADERLDVMRCMSQGMSGVMRCFNSNMVMLAHGGASIACGMSPDLPREIVDHLKLDVSVERSWSRGNKQDQALRISGKIKEVLQPTA